MHIFVTVNNTRQLLPGLCFRASCHLVCGMQYIIEMKIWRGKSYNERSEKQLVEYLDHYHLQKGYMQRDRSERNQAWG